MSRPRRSLRIAKLIVFSLLFGFLGAGIVGWAVYGRPWLGIGALLAVLVLGALAWYLNRWTEMDDLERVRWGVLIGLVALALASSWWSLGRTGDLESGALNLGTELIGAVVTYALFELVIERRERRKAAKKEAEKKKAQLIAQLGSNVRDAAVSAAVELRRQGWLSDRSLQAANLCNADLRGADLKLAHLVGAKLAGANLEGADLQWAQLRETDLMVANLKEAVLLYANLEGANLIGAQLVGANLAEANLRRATLWRANLLRAYLSGADLNGARLWIADPKVAHQEATLMLKQLAQARSLAGATLPDGTKLSKEHWREEFEEWREKQGEGEGDE
jgi:uncharacterized protein YjbI with pentapeptide repeats